MWKSTGICLAGSVFYVMLAFLAGCSGSGGSYSTTYYRGYYDPYPGWGYRPIYIDNDHDHHHNRPPGNRPPGGKPPGIGRPPGGKPPGMGRPPGGGRPRPTQLPARRR